MNTNGVTILNWKDRRNVLMLSTKNDDEMVERRHVKLVSKVVLDYNRDKGSIEISDQMGSNPLRRSIKWYRKVLLTNRNPGIL